MANEINIYEPRYLAEAVRTAPPICTFLRDRFFSKVKTFPTKNVDIDIVKGNRKMAAFVHPMVGGEIVQNEGYETKSYAPPLINPELSPPQICSCSACPVRISTPAAPLLTVQQKS